MARVTVATVDHLARLAHLSLDDDERAVLARQLEQILTYAETIQALDTEGVEPMSHAHVAGRLRDDKPPLRDDTTTPGLPREAVLAAAPDAEDGLFRVPRVIGA